MPLVESWDCLSVDELVVLKVALKAGCWAVELVDMRDPSGADYLVDLAVVVLVARKVGHWGE